MSPLARLAPVMKPLTEHAARDVLTQKLARLSCKPSHSADRVPDGWLFTPTADAFPQTRWVVGDNGCCARAPRHTDPGAITANLTAGSRPSVLIQDLIRCACGHLSSTHGFGTPSPDPVTGRVSGLGRGTCGAEWPMTNEPPEPGDLWVRCDCETLQPAGP